MNGGLLSFFSIILYYKFARVNVDKQYLYWHLIGHNNMILSKIYKKNLHILSIAIQNTNYTLHNWETLTHEKIDGEGSKVKLDGTLRFIATL